MKSGFVALIGRPNVGKSTLLNQLLGTKVSIVTPKPQTTRKRILGVLTLEDAQIVFLDTPGLLSRTKYELHRRMMDQARTALQDADLVLFMVEPVLPTEEDEAFLDLLRRAEKPAILVVNKIDRVYKPEILPVIDAYTRLYPFKEAVPISALKRDGLDILLSVILKYLPEGPPFYDPETVTPEDLRTWAAEIIREKIFELYGEEVPYSTAVEVEEFVNNDPAHGGKTYIRAVIYVERESQKPILIGRGGEKIKKVGIRARKEMEAFLGREIHLELWVKVRPRWRKDPAFLKRLGL